MDKQDRIFIAFMFYMIGLVSGAAIMGTLSTNHPEQLRGVEKLLDKDKYTVDTTITIYRSDTVYKCKFIKIGKQ